MSQASAMRSVISREFVAPARVNLLGEHTDYTGGYVMPMAIPFTTVASISAIDAPQYTFDSERFPEVRTLSLDDRSEGIHNWSDYPVGVLRQLQLRGITPAAFHLQLRGNVPFGAGLSSSASIEVASAFAMLAHADVSLSEQEIAVLCRAAENNYVHSPCGIMDQFVITAAKAGHALLLNTRTLAYEHLPMNQGDLARTSVVVCNSMVKHSVASGEYGVRHREVMEGQAALMAALPHLKDLGDATVLQLDEHKAAMSPQSYARCRHILTENSRVLQAREAMYAGDAAALGQLINAAHISERDDFACSCEEVDFLVETAQSLPGCYGARLTGGGFGGCTVNLVQESAADAFAIGLKLAYRERYGIDAETYLCEAVDGAVVRNDVVAKVQA